MSLFSDDFTYNRSLNTITGTGNSIGRTITINYTYSPNIDIRGNKHGYIYRIAELQRLVAKHPNRVDLKMELQRLQKTFSPKIGKRKKKK